MSSKLIVLDPRGNVESSAATTSRRPRTLEGVRLGMLDNLKPNSTLLLDHVLDRLQEKYRFASITRLAKHSPTGSVSAEAIEELKASDVVLVSLADCGGCTAWSIQDAIELERRGIPTVTFVGDAFVKMATTMSKARGVKSLAMVLLPYPFGTLESEAVYRELDAVMDKVVEAATGSSEVASAPDRVDVNDRRGVLQTA